MKLHVSIFLAAILSVFAQADAQIVYETEFKENADKIVFVEEEDGRADLNVYKTDWKSDARQQEGVWYFTQWRSEADFAVFFTEFKSEADFVIRFTEIKSDAGTP